MHKEHAISENMKYKYVTGVRKVGERIIHYLLLALIYRNLDKELIQKNYSTFPLPPAKQKLGT